MNDIVSISFGYAIITRPVLYIFYKKYFVENINFFFSNIHMLTFTQSETIDVLDLEIFSIRHDGFTELIVPVPVIIRVPSGVPTVGGNVRRGVMRIRDPG